MSKVKSFLYIFFKSLEFIFILCYSILWKLRKYHVRTDIETNPREDS